ncbi:MAG: cytochrome c oxidase subunit II [Gemmatimonadetes bacterium]|nr:cytochrome c oxidase subunit II [Gemmatimonadota bacterium]NIO31086.1 cytochrome c oxidase subunit II [Gemmatimonadota bacterium]
MDWLPGAASSYAADLDRIFYVILAITGLIFVGVQVALVYFIIKYRGREGRRASYIEGSTKAEVIWTVIPAVIIVGIAVASQTVWSEIKDPNHFPTNALEVNVEARQFAWAFTYPGADGELGTEDDYIRYNQMHVPVNRPVVFNLTSADVVHSFFVPAFRIKQDAVPGLNLRAWFEATEVGEYELACAELCGVAHGLMKGKIIVLAEDEFRSWAAEQS